MYSSWINRVRILLNNNNNHHNIINILNKISVRHLHTTTKSNLPTNLPLFKRAIEHGDKTAIIDFEDQKKLSFRDILNYSGLISNELLLNRQSDLNQKHVAFLTAANSSYVFTQWGIWRSGGVAVPISPSHVESEIEYILTDSKIDTVITSSQFEKVVKPISEKLGIRYISLNIPDLSIRNNAYLPVTPTYIDPKRDALIIYTSGTTSKPKGVVSTHSNIEAQVTTLIQAWEWKNTDHILQVLPLHHVHGIINVLTCSLWSGAVCEMMTKFDSNVVWNRFARDKSLTLFMAVPTIYAKLIKSYEEMTLEKQKEATSSLQSFRLMVSGSAALPTTVMNRWKQISNHFLLERYGMTEIGMALSNPLNGERTPGTVGFPLPNVNVKLATTENNEHPTEGELLIKGPQVFKEYFGKPQATKEAFDENGWFKTGDIASVDKNGRYSILGRSSVDIIKSGGYKISALDIERTLLEMDAIAEIAVVGIDDNEYGQKIAAIVVMKKDYTPLTLESLQQWAKGNMSHYKIPRILKILPEIPRNALGKVNKKELVKLFH